MKEKIENSKKELEILKKTARDPEELIICFNNRGCDGIVFGYQHGAANFFAMMANSLIPTLKRIGVKTLYLEKDQNYQSQVDRYLETGEYQEELKSYLSFFEAYWDGGEQTVLILEAARKYGLEVRFIDQPGLPFSFFERDQLVLRGKDRDEHMFLNIKDHQKFFPEKYAVVTGYSHAAISMYEQEGEIRNPLAHRLGTLHKRVFSSITVGKGTSYVIEIYKALFSLSFDGSKGWDFREIENRGTFLDNQLLYSKKLLSLYSGLIFCSSDMQNRNNSR